MEGGASFATSPPAQKGKRGGATDCLVPSSAAEWNLFATAARVIIARGNIGRKRRCHLLSLVLVLLLF
jgi:hypothetical protein